MIDSTFRSQRAPPEADGWRSGLLAAASLLYAHKGVETKVATGRSAPNYRTKGQRSSVLKLASAMVLLYPFGVSSKKEFKQMADLDWSQCPAVESIPGKVSGAWVFRDTRLPVATVIENLEDLSVEEVMEQFDVTREQITAVLDFVAQSLRTSAPGQDSAPVDAHSL